MSKAQSPGSPGKWRVFKALFLNFPDPEVPSLSDRLRGRSKPATKQDKEPEVPSERAGSVWATAAAEATPTPVQAEDEEEPLWKAVTPSTKSTPYKKGVRWTVLILLALFLWIGIRAAIFGVDSNQQAPQLPKTATFNNQAAAGTAERFSVAYLAWNEDDVEGRATRMSAWYSGGNAPSDLGWDGHGKQTAENPTVRNVAPIDQTHARVTVTVDVTPYQGGKAQATQTQTIEVRVAVNEHGSAVYGTPGMVGNPAPITASEPKDNKPKDSNLAQQTKPEAKKFLEAYGQQTDLGSITAPGASIQGLGGTLKDPTLREWTVIDGDGEERTAQAVVQWTTASGAKSEQSYEIKLVKVSGGESAKWQVGAINGTESSS